MRGAVGWLGLLKGLGEHGLGLGVYTIVCRRLGAGSRELGVLGGSLCPGRGVFSGEKRHGVFWISFVQFDAFVLEEGAVPGVGRVGGLWPAVDTTWGGCRWAGESGV